VRVDSHQHFWRYHPERQAWIDDRMSSLKRDFMPVELQLALRRAGFDASIAVQAAQSLAETCFLLDLADHHDFIRGVVGWVDLRAPNVEETLAELAAHERFKGVRHIAQSEPAGFLAEPAFRAGVSRLARFGLTYDVLIHAHQLPEALELARALPHVSFVLDHVAKPPVRSGQLSPWREQLRRLAELPNVCCKLSGLVTEADWKAWSPSQLRPFLDVAAESFGWQRLLVGSDWPVCTLAGSYEQVTRVLSDYVAGWSAAERAAVFGENATRIYRLQRF
jgi:L-fuconolactonase